MKKRSKSLMTLSESAMLLLSILLLTGCAKAVILHPITGQDIIALDKGANYTAPKQGWFLSDEYLTEIQKVRVK
jgi:hypothetical protein